jgi:hypothetical protein
MRLRFKIYSVYASICPIISIYKTFLKQIYLLIIVSWYHEKDVQTYKKCPDFKNQQTKVLYG